MVQKICILVVDNDTKSRGDTARVLTSAGYEVLEAATGHDCLRLASEHAPDLILLDVHLPDMDGFEVCRSVKAAPRLAGSFVVLISGVEVAAEGQSERLDAGADSYITRPESDHELLAWVEVLLRAKRAEETLREQARAHTERAKELGCLYGISALVERVGFALPTILQGIAELLPPAWQYPEVTAARIVLDGCDFSTANYLRTEWRQLREIQVRGESVGAVEVCYLEEMPEQDEGPFLKVERRLLNAIAERLGRIVERVWAQEALKESELRYRALFESAPVGIGLATKTGRILEANEALLQMTGYGAADLPQVNVRDMYGDPQDRERFLEQVTADGAVRDFQVPMKRKDGTPFPTRLSTRLLTLGGEDTVLTVVEDVTVRKLSEDRLAEQLQFVQTLLATIPNPVFYQDSQGRYIGCNKAFAEFIGLADEAIIGKTVYDVAPKTIADEYFEKDQELLENPGQQRYEWQVRVAGGELRDAIFHKATFTDADGNIGGLIGVISDITDHRRVEEALRESESRLRTVFESLPFDLFVLGEDERYVMQNSKFRERWGDLIGKRVADADVDGETLALWRENNQRALAGELVQDEVVLCPHGEVGHYYNIISPIHDGARVRGILGVNIDITARKRAEQKLAETNQLLETIFAHTHMLAAYLDPQFDFVWVNQAYAAADQREPSFFPGKNHFELYPNEENEAIFRRVVETGEAHYSYAKPFEYAEHPERGVSFWDWGLVPIKDSTGDVTGSVLTLLDVTERIRTQEALKRSEERYAMAQRAAHIGSWDWSILSGELHWSEEIGPMFGFERGEFGATYEAFLECVHPDDREQVIAAINTCVEEGADYAIEHRIVWPDGTVRWVSETGDVLRDAKGKAVRMLGVVRDITARRRAVDALIESEERYRDLVENIDDVIYALDERGVLTYVSPAIESFIGYPSREATGLHFGAFCHPEDLSRMRKGFQKLLSGQAATDEYRAVTKSGEIRWMRTSSRPIMDGDRVAGVQGVLVDITERKTGEGALREAKEAAEVARRDEEERRQEADERRRIAEGLADVVAVLNSNKSLDEVLDFIAVQAGQMLDNQAVAIYSLQGEPETLAIEAAYGLPIGYVAGADIPIGHSALRRAVLSKAPVPVPDVVATFEDDQDLAQDAYRRALVEYWADIYSALLAVPIVVKDETYGGIMLYYADTREFSEDEIELARVFANQAALAIENSRLRDQVRETAATAERSRLARELHDAVTQTLFSASLIAEALPRVWEKDRESGRRGLDELRQLTRGASAEMRTMLLELRPAALTEKPLGELLRHLADAVTGRSRVPVTLTVEGDSALPAQAQIALYRIAQEALNNVSKHAGASKAEVELRCRPGSVKLSVRDDGCGFDPRDVRPDQLGLAIMGERAERISASLEINSQPGHGTQVVVDWQPLRGREFDA
jgi:PAS domain S-box-containing protein